MESARVRDFHTSWWSIWNRTSERSERVGFLILHQRVWKSRTKRFPCCNLFILYILSLLRACKACLTCSNWLSWITQLHGYLQAFKCRLKLQISPLKLEGSKSSPSFLLTAIINSLIYSLSSFGGISSILLLSFFGVEKLSQQSYISSCLWKSVLVFLVFDKLVNRFVWRHKSSWLFSHPQKYLLALDKFELRTTRVHRKYYLVKAARQS